MSKYTYDLLVIGGGSGGVRASRWAANLPPKPKVGLVELPFGEEKGGLGGTCVLRGCVPKKLLWYGGHYSHDITDSTGYGWGAQTPAHDWGKLMEKKRVEMLRLNGVYGNLLKGASVDLLEGFGSLVDAHTVDVDGKQYTAETILVAVGAAPHVLDVPGKEHCITSDQLLNLASRPEKMLVLGAGYIAVEMACIMKGYGVDVDVVFRADKPLRGFDEDLRSFIAEQMAGHGLGMRSGEVPVKVEKQANGKFTVHTKKGDELLQTTDVDVVLMATGRKPQVAGLGLEKAGVALNAKGAIQVDDYSKTTVDNIYAVGDVTDRIQLTPVALHEAVCFANTLYDNKKQAPCHEIVPSAVFTTPPLGVCGITEEQAVKQYQDVDVYTSGFRPMVHTLSGSSERAFMKIIVDAKSDKVLGVHMGGKDSSEIIQGFGVAMKCGATKANFDSCIGVHPSSAEELVTMRTPSRRYRNGELQAKI